MSHWTEDHIKDITQRAETGVPAEISGGMRRHLPSLDDLVIAAGSQPVAGEIEADLEIGIERYTKYKMEMSVPIFISEMSYGEVSRPAKMALIYGAALAKTALFCGDGGLLDSEREIVDELDGQIVAKFSKSRHGVTGEYINFGNAVCIDMAAGPHVLVPAKFVTKEIASVYGTEKGQDITSPARHMDIESDEDLKMVVEMLREATDYHVPIIVKYSGGELYEKVRNTIESGADAVLLEGMEMWNAGAIETLQENVGSPLLGLFGPATQAMRDAKGKQKGFKLLVQGGIKSGADVFKALALGADAVGLDTAALIAIGCRLHRECNGRKCPEGIATLDPKLEAKVNWKDAGKKLSNVIKAMTAEAKQIAAYAGIRNLNAASTAMLKALTHDAAAITGIKLLGFDRTLPMWLH